MRMQALHRLAHQVVALRAHDARLDEVTHLVGLAGLLGRQQVHQAVDLGRIGIAAAHATLLAQAHGLVHQHLHGLAHALLQARSGNLFGHGHEARAALLTHLQGQHARNLVGGSAFDRAVGKAARSRALPPTRFPACCPWRCVRSAARASWPWPKRFPLRACKSAWARPCRCWWTSPWAWARRVAWAAAMPMRPRSTAWCTCCRPRRPARPTRWVTSSRRASWARRATTWWASLCKACIRIPEKRARFSLPAFFVLDGPRPDFDQGVQVASLKCCTYFDAKKGWRE